MFFVTFLSIFQCLLLVCDAQAAFVCPVITKEYLEEKLLVFHLVDKISLFGMKFFAVFVRF